MVRGTYLPEEDARIRTQRTLKKCPGADLLRQELHERKQQELSTIEPLSLTG